MIHLLIHSLSDPFVQNLQDTAYPNTEYCSPNKLQGNRGGTGKSRQNSHGTGIAKLAGAAPHSEAPL